MFTFFTDRDGKMQLAALAQSGFDPLSRTCRFMLTEEAHHMFVGETGVQRIIQRTCEAMREAGIDDPHDVERVRALGVIDLPTIQRKVNLHFSLTLDLFGSEISTNAANAFNAGLKGRYREDKLTDDHQLLGDTYPVLRLKDGAIVQEDVPALSSLNMRLRDDFVADAAAGVARWNRVLERAGDGIPHPPAACRIQPPHRRVRRGARRHRRQAAGRRRMGRAQADTMLPTAEDYRFVDSLMRPVQERGAYAGWIAPPRIGIDNKPGDFEYVKIEGMKQTSPALAGGNAAPAACAEDLSKSCFVAIAAPSASVFSFAQAISGCTRPPSPQSVPASTFSRPTSFANRTIRSATRSGCSTTLVAWLTTPGMISFPAGSFTILPHPPFMLVPHVASLERVGLRVDRQHHIDDVAHRDVGDVRAVPASPAQMEADAVLRQTLDRVVQRLDPDHGELAISLHGRRRIDLVPVLGDRRIVELQHQPGIDDRLVFLAHRVGAGVDELFLGLVVLVADARATARRDRGHETFLDPRRLPAPP